MKTKHLLAGSLFLNAVLGIAMIAWMAHRPAAAPSLTETPQTSVTPELVSNQPAPEQAGNPPFHWSQLESTNYPTYIANLRGIGCPEQTVRDIVTADVDGLYAPERSKLDAQEQSLRTNGSLKSSQKLVALEVERRRIFQEEATAVAELLGLPVQAATVATVTETNLAQQVVPDATKPVEKISMPLVFAGIGPNSTNLNSNQMALLTRMQQAFIVQLGGSNADPSSPEYAQRWSELQPKVDRSLRTLLGTKVYLQLQAQARRQVMSAQGTSAQ
jgi:hypothetical protein